MVNLIENLSKITTIPQQGIQNLVNKSEDIICHELLQRLGYDDFLEIDIGIGKLNILLMGDELYYKYIPSKEFENKLIDCIKSKKSPLTQAVENQLKSKMIKAYKELF